MSADVVSTDITLTQRQAKQMIVDLSTAMQTLKRYGMDDGQLTHRERKAVEMVVFFMLKDVKADLVRMVNSIDPEHDDIPF